MRTLRRFLSVRTLAAALGAVMLGEIPVPPAAAGEIAAIAPDIVHAQHLTCLSSGLPRAVHGLGIPFVLTLNDYWLICHRGQLFDELGLGFHFF